MQLVNETRMICHSTDLYASIDKSLKDQTFVICLPLKREVQVQINTLKSCLVAIIKD